MITIVGVRFKPVGKIYYFNPADIDIHTADKVIVETIRGIEMGTVVIGPKEISEDEISKPLKMLCEKQHRKIYSRQKKTAKRKRRPSAFAAKKYVSMVWK